ncbi:MAG: hypothetical protein R2706_07625 [Acidimicrobiales bacterium]
MLHGSAVVVDDAVYAFVGESGRGKSTLAAFLLTAGLRRTADDLIAVRLADNKVLAADGRQLTPLGAVFFIDRHDADPMCEPLSEADALHHQIRNGFGEHGHAPTWRWQFDLYGGLVDAVPHFRFTQADDLAKLPESQTVFEAVVATLPDGPVT